MARGLRRAADLFPWTPLGLLVGLSSAFALSHFAYAQMDLVLLVLGYGALGLVLLGTLMVGIAALWTKLRAKPALRDGPLRLETRQPSATGFTLASLAWLPLVQLDWSWERPPGFTVKSRRTFRRLMEVIEAEDRGEREGLRRRVVVQDAFGLARLALRIDDPLCLEVLPHVGKLRRLPILASLSGGDEQPHPMGLEDGDRVELRRYAPGDPARFIHWKVFARTRKLVVRMPERALTRARRTIAYLVAGDGDDATAAAARVALESDAFGTEWTFCADGATEDASRVSEALPQIVRSAAARAKGGVGLESFLARAERSGPATAVVFVPPEPGPWLDHVVRAAKRRRGRMRVVVGVDGLVKHAGRSRLRRLLTAERVLTGTAAESLEDVLRKLAGTRAEVVVVDRASGRLLGAAHRAAARRAVERAA